MARYFQALMSVVLALAAGHFVSVQAQADAAPICFTSKIAGRETKWNRHELGILSICIPETMVRRKTKTCGEKCYIFENETMFFDLDMTTSAWRPTFEKRFPTFSVVNQLLEGKAANFWSFEDKGKYKYVNGVNVIFERGQIGMGAYLFSMEPDSKPIAERMFRSIRFTAPTYAAASVPVARTQ